jgi:hypothetical protein
MNSKMKNEKLIHVKLDYNETINSKKDILASQANLLTVLRTMKKYKPLRIAELKAKIKLHKKIQETIKDIKKLEKTLPEIEMPEIIKEHFDEEIERKIARTKKETYDINLESQLQDIQDKLRQLAN